MKQPNFEPEFGRFTSCPAPAKLNLFLHVTGQRADGYHLLESAFQLIDLADTLHFNLRNDSQIKRCNDIPGVPAETDLVVRAAKLLQSHTQSRQGVEIILDKKLPMGGGLGGGSSDAATTLIALNQLWQSRLSQQELIDLGVKLGADIPFFLFGQNAFAQGIGEKLSPLVTPDYWYVVLQPGVLIPTQAIFSAKALTRNSPSIKVADFQCYPLGNWRNDLQSVAVQLFPEVAFSLEWLNRQEDIVGNAKMTGSGSCVFCACDNETAADKILENVRIRNNNDVADKSHNWTAWKSKSLSEHPMQQWVGSK